MSGGQAPNRGARFLRATLRALDRLTLLAVAAGIVMVLQPFWAGGFRFGFFFTIGAVVAQIVTSHLVSEDEA